MGLSNFIMKLFNGDPEERRIRKEVNAEAKIVEQKAFQDQYRISRLEKAEEKGKAKAVKAAYQGGSGGGLLNTLGKIGANMNAASKGLVANIEINPSGSKETFQTVDPFESTQFGTERQIHRNVYPGNKTKRKQERQSNEPEFNVIDPFDISDLK
jgi:hypothetical protein